MRDIEYEIYEKEIQPRIDSLVEQGNHLEAFFFLIAVLEKEIIELIELYEEEVARKKIKLKSFRVKNFKLMMLGRLNDYLSVFNDSNIIEEISYFSELRNRCVHKIFENNPSSLNKQIKENLGRFYRLLSKLLQIKITLIQKQTRRTKTALKNKQNGTT